ncbi:MAG: hypothetical protein QM656_12340 [Paracoccaceae bacterium]
MRILSARILHAHLDRDFGQVEAMVALLVKAEGRPVPFEITIRTAEPTGRDLRRRLLASARGLHEARLARHTEMRMAA